MAKQEKFLPEQIEAVIREMQRPNASKVAPSISNAVPETAYASMHYVVSVNSITGNEQEVLPDEVDIKSDEAVRAALSAKKYNGIKKWSLIKKYIEGQVVDKGKLKDNKGRTRTYKLIHSHNPDSTTDGVPTRLELSD